MVPSPAAVCPSCGQAEVALFYQVAKVPTNSVLLLTSKKRAENFPAGSIDLSYCHACDHIFNASFDPQKTEYSGRYESTQGFSGTFNRFHERLARDLIDQFALNGKNIIEIGCGNGEFLKLLCEIGHNQGIGFDPAYQPGRVPIRPETQINFVADFYSETYRDQPVDFLVCKMTLEHIYETGRFVKMIRQALDHNPNATLFLQVPNGRYVLQETAFWDVYYEHCSYFTAESLTRLLEQERFQVTSCWTDYNNQYLMTAATPADNHSRPRPSKKRGLLHAAVDAFAEQALDAIDGWRQFIQSERQLGNKIVLWGGGSKAVAFLTTLKITDGIDCVVDINPHKAHTFLPGIGHEIVPPTDLVDRRPDTVVVMNPIYIPEITAALDEVGLTPEVLGVDSHLAARSAVAKRRSERTDE